MRRFARFFYRGVKATAFLMLPDGLRSRRTDCSEGQSVPNSEKARFMVLCNPYAVRTFSVS